MKILFKFIRALSLCLIIMANSALFAEENDSYENISTTSLALEFSSKDGITPIGFFANAGQKFELEKIGARLQLTLPLIPFQKDASNSIEGNLAKLKLGFSAGELSISGPAAVLLDNNQVEPIGNYYEFKLVPTLGLLTGFNMAQDQANRQLFGLELGTKIALACENLNQKQKKILGITNSNCHMKYGLLLEATVYYLTLGLEMTKKIAESNGRIELFEVKAFGGVKIPLSNLEKNITDTERDNYKEYNELDFRKTSSNIIKAVSV